MTTHTQSGSSPVSSNGQDENNFHFRTAKNASKVAPPLGSSRPAPLQINPQGMLHQSSSRPGKPASNAGASPLRPPRSFPSHRQASPGRLSIASKGSHQHVQEQYLSSSAAAIESLKAIRRQSDTLQQQVQQHTGRSASPLNNSSNNNSSHSGRAWASLSRSNTPSRNRDSPSVQSGLSGPGEAWQWQNNDPDHQEQALFEQRLTEDIYGVAVRKINHNGKANLRYIKCCFVDAAELDVDANGFSSSRSVTSFSNRPRFSRFRDRSVERSESRGDVSLMSGKKVKVLTWGKKKEIKLPLERFVVVRKGKTTDRTKRNICPPSRIVSLITDDPYCPSLDIEAPTRLDRDKFAKAFSRFLSIPLEGDDVRSIRSDLTPQSMKGESSNSNPFIPLLPLMIDPCGIPAASMETAHRLTDRLTHFAAHFSHRADSPRRSTSQINNRSPNKTSQINPAATAASGTNSHATNNSSSNRRKIPLPIVTTDRSSRPRPPPVAGGKKKILPSAAARMAQKEAEPLNFPDPQMASLPSTQDSKEQKPNISTMTTEHNLTIDRSSAQPEASGGHDRDDRSDVSSLTGAGFDQEIVEELHMALTEMRAELEESRAEAARAVKVAEQAIQSAENNSSKDWNSTVTHKAAAAAALAQKKSAEAMTKARMAEERLEQERKKATLWKKQAETAGEEVGHWQTRAAAAEVQRAALAETLASERQRNSGALSQLDASGNSILQVELDRLRTKLAVESATRRRLLSEVQDLRGAVRVYCRPRAVSKGISTISTPAQEVLLLHRERASFRPDGAAKVTPLSFEFDGIVASDMDQQDLYDEMEPVCLSVLDGYKACFMTYGQAGAGKTYSMLGKISYQEDGSASISDFGIQLRAAEQFFEVVQHRRERYKDIVKFTLVEVSNDRLTDLVVGTSIGEAQGRIEGRIEGTRKSSRKNADGKDEASLTENPARLEIKTNRDGETVVNGLVAVEVSNFDDVLNVWRQSLSARRQRLIQQGVDVLEHDTHSHLIGTFRVQSTNLVTRVSTTGKVQFVDLAASDVAPRRATGPGSKKPSTPETVMTGVGNDQEWKFADRSMAVLTEVVNARSQFQRTVPYRNSTITHLLSDSMEADTKVVVVACISSALKDLQDTACTLKFAETIRKVVVGKATKHSFTL